jgi:hypothetical protein
MFSMALQFAQMHQNLILTTPDIEKNVFYDIVPDVLAV